MSKQLQVPRGVVIRGAINDDFASVLTLPALQFLAALHRRFNERRLGLLRMREQRQTELDAGVLPTFLEHTQWIREGEWKAAWIPHDLKDRRTEITGPVDRKMVINALNSGAKVYMADFEDSSCPTWVSMMEGQVNLRDAVRRTISFKNEQGKEYKLKPAGQLSTLMVRPRGWHLDEAHIVIDGHSSSGSLTDFGLFFFHNAHQLIKNGSGPYFYLPKTEGHLECRLWNDVFVFAQEQLAIPRGTIRATVLLETFPAAFEMDEMIFELREHSAGMNCGRWDYIFSAIKKLAAHKQFVLPDRPEVTMTTPFMANYVKLLIQTCHKRGVHAMGGMSAFIPVKGDAAANKAAMDKVKADKLREVKAGHDGTWVAHPDLVKLATDIFNEFMPTAHQIDIKREHVNVAPKDLLPTGVKGNITEAGLRGNIEVGLLYLEAWLRGIGCVPIHNLMEDAATAEICRSQIWQWIKHGASLQLTKGGSVTISKPLVQQLLREEVDKLSKKTKDPKALRALTKAVEIYEKLMLSDYYIDFMTSEAYPFITEFVQPAIKSNL